MAIIPDDEDYREFMFAYGHFIVSWNHVELAAKDILVFLTGGNIAATIVSHQIGNASLTDAIRVSSRWYPDAKDHLIHFAKLMDTIRAYRNYYIHNLLGLGRNDEHGAVGLVLSLTVKGKYELYEKALILGDLRNLIEQTEATRCYAIEIHTIMKENEDMEARLPLFALLEKPALPETLAKHVRDPQAPEYLPEASEA